MSDAPSMTPEESYNQALGITPDQGAEAPESGLEAGQEENQAPEPDAPAAPRNNPSWEEAWKDVPAPVRDQLIEQQRPIFERWDRDFQELQARHRPFQEYEQNGVSPVQLEQALQVHELLFSNPREFYDRMGATWGFSEQKESLQQRTAAGVDIDPSEYDDPVIKQLAEKVQQQQQFIENFQQQETQAQQQARQQQEQQRNVAWTENQMSTLEAKVGALTTDDKRAIIERAITNANLGRNASVEVAYYDIKRQEDEWAQRYAQRAPRVLGGGGATPTNQPAPVDYSKETPEDRLARAMAVAKQAAESFQQ